MVKQRMFVAEYMLLNGVSKQAYFTTDKEARAWVKEANRSNLLESFMIDHRDVRMEEFI